MTQPEQFVAKRKSRCWRRMQRPVSDRTSYPSYNAYSIDGDVTAPLVYVNYWPAADYERAARARNRRQGKIVIRGYGNSWRGIKPKVAAEHGAIGCLIYSGPARRRYFVGDVYPKRRLASITQRPASGACWICPFIRVIR